MQTAADGFHLGREVAALTFAATGKWLDSLAIADTHVDLGLWVPIG